MPKMQSNLVVRTLDRTSPDYKALRQTRSADHRLPQCMSPELAHRRHREVILRCPLREGQNGRLADRRRAEFDPNRS
jgi:hypothetical protein